MAYEDKLRQIDQLRVAIQAQGPLPADVLKKVNYKFRLEWNYTSNSMEGNSLTRSETRSVMIGNITVHGKPIKDVLEMKGHDAVITDILKLGAGELQLSESRIRDIHRGIMHEEDAVKAAFVGRWKLQDNYLFNYKNERIDFTPHAEVAEAMHRLTDWLAAQREKIKRGDADAPHPAVLAFRFHLDYVTIHPFYDGNGRTARILSNLILITYNYPPIWIKESGGERDAYYQYLADVQGYGGSPDVLYDFMAGLLLRSQHLMLDAVEGREIEEPDDIDKEIALFKKSIDKSTERKELKTMVNVLNVVEHSAIPLFEKFRTKLSQFNELFHAHDDRIIFNTAQTPVYDLRSRSGGFMISTELFPEATYNWLRGPKSFEGEIIAFSFEYFLKGYKLAAPQDLSVLLSFEFDEYQYSVVRKGAGGVPNKDYLKKPYDMQLDEADIILVVNDTTKAVLSMVKEIAEKI